MAFTTKAGMSFTTPAGTISNVLGEYSTDALVEYDFEVAPATTDKACDAAFPYADIKAINISSSGACTIETNSATVPDDTVTLTSTVLAKVWTHDGKAGNLSANPLTANVTKLYITNPSPTATITVKVRVAYDGTV